MKIAKHNRAFEWHYFQWPLSDLEWPRCQGHTVARPLTLNCDYSWAFQHFTYRSSATKERTSNGLTALQCCMCRWCSYRSQKLATFLLTVWLLLALDALKTLLLGIQHLLNNCLLVLSASHHFYHTTHMHSADNHAVARCLSVRPSDVRPPVRLSHAGILSKRINISSNFFHSRVATPSISTPSGMAISIFRRGPDPAPPPLTGASNARGIAKIAIFDQYLALSRKWYKIDLVIMENK